MCCFDRKLCVAKNVQQRCYVQRRGNKCSKSRNACVILIAGASAIYGVLPASGMKRHSEYVCCMIQSSCLFSLTACCHC